MVATCCKVYCRAIVIIYWEYSSYWQLFCYDWAKAGLRLARPRGIGGEETVQAGTWEGEQIAVIEPKPQKGVLGYIATKKHNISQTKQQNLILWEVVTVQEFAQSRWWQKLNWFRWVEPHCLRMSASAFLYFCNRGIQLTSFGAKRYRQEDPSDLIWCKKMSRYQQEDPTDLIDV